MPKNRVIYRIFAVFQTTILIASLFCPHGFAQDNNARTKAPETVFSNTTPITIGTNSGVTAPTRATLYPSTIEVAGMTGTITRVAVTLDGVNHGANADADYLLVSPTGAKYVFLSECCAATDKIYTFADDGVAIPGLNEPPSGTYRPLNGDSVANDAFPAPAPAGPYNFPPAATFASTFNGANPNGTWSLYAVDDALGNAGSINGGWALTITTGGAPQTFANSNYIGLHDVVAPSTPYGTIVNVSGLAGVISGLKVTIDGISHPSPQDIDIMLVSPNGKSMILLSDRGGSTPAANAVLTFDDAAPTTVNTVTTGTYKPTDAPSESFGDFFASPAPFRPYQPTADGLSGFYGSSPNGEWRLLVVDDAPENAGTIAGGWSLDITTAPPPPPPAPSCSAPSFSATNFMTGLSPTNVAVADYNNDSKPDLAVANQVTNDVSVLLGNGDGTFGGQSLFTVGAGPYGIVAGKFNADNNWDLAVTNSSSNNVSILLGNGSGGFSAATSFFVGASPLSVATGDFNNDGKADLAVANFGGFFAGTVSILLGTGSGAFTTGTSVRTRSQPSFVAVARFNADANDDLIIANFGADSVSTFFGNGAGGFQLQQNITVPGGPVAIEIADLGTDGILDIAVAKYNLDSVRICSGTTAGGFTNCTDGDAGGSNPISITAADFVGGGTKNIATALSGSDWVRVLTSTVSVGQNPNAVESADFNGDGKPDIVSVNYGSNDVTVMLNSCRAARGNIFDYSGDRRTDFAVFRPGTQQYFIQALNSTGPFRVFGRPTDKLVPADFNGDLRTDLAFYRPSNGLWHITDQNQRPLYFLQFGLPEDIPVPADFDGDGKADIAVFRPSNGNWYIRLSTDNSVATVAFGQNGDKPVAADFDGDGTADIGVFRPSTGVWYIARSTGGYIITQFGIAGDLTVAGDYDGDGRADIAVWRPSSGAWYVLKSSDGGFIASGWGQTGDIPVPGDYEGDGRYDFAVWRPADNVWYVRKSADGGAIYFQWGISSDVPVPSAFVR